MAPHSTFGARMLRCPACNAGLPVDGKAAIVTCQYCNARVEIDRRGQPVAQGSIAPPQHPSRLWTWLSVPLVLLFSGGMAAYQWSRAQSLPSPPSTTPVVTTTPLRPTVTPMRTVTKHPPAVEPVATQVAQTPTAAPPSAPAKQPRGKKPPTPKPASTFDRQAVRDVIAALDDRVKACPRDGKQHSPESFGFSIAGPSGRVISVSTTQGGPFWTCAVRIYKGAVFPKVQTVRYEFRYQLTL